MAQLRPVRGPRLPDRLIRPGSDVARELERFIEAERRVWRELGVSPSARRVVVPAAEHGPRIDDPETCVAHTLRFLAA